VCEKWQRYSIVDGAVFKKVCHQERNMQALQLPQLGVKLQATNRVPRPVDRGTATRYGG